MAPLNRAVALPQVHHVAVAIGQHLHLHVPRPIDEFLHVEARVAKGGLRFPLGSLEQAFELVWAWHQAHAAATPTSGGFDHHRIAHRFRQGGRLTGVLQEPLAAGDGGHPHPLHGGLGGGLVPHGADRLGRGAHEGDAVIAAHLGETVVFSQKAVTRMDGVGPTGGGCRQNVGNI